MHRYPVAIAALCLGLAIQATSAESKKVPAWFNTAEVNAWTLLDENNPSTACTAFGGAVINTVGVYIGPKFVAGTWYIQFGGGHAAGNDNRVYAWGPFEDDKPAWHTLSSFVPLGEEVFNGPGPKGKSESDLYPAAPHTYDQMIFYPKQNWMQVGMSAIPGTNNTNFDMWVFDFTVSDPTVNNPWKKCGEKQGQPLIEAVSCYDSVLDRGWRIKSDTTTYLYYVPGKTPAEFTQTGVTQTGFSFAAANAAFHPSGLMVVSLNMGKLSELQVINLRTGQFASVKPAGNGPTLMGSNDHSSIQWVPSENKFALYTDLVADGKKIWWITTGADATTLKDWTWSCTTATGGVTPHRHNGPLGDGIYSKFNVIQAGPIKGLVFIPQEQGGPAPLYFWRLPEVKKAK